MPEFALARIHDGAAAMELLVILWFVGSIVVAGVLANSKGRSVVGWCFLALLIGWIAVIILACTTNLLEQARQLERVEKGALEDARRAESAQKAAEHRAAMAELNAEATKVQLAQKAAAAPGDTRDCPYCAETIKAAAKVCRFCNRDVEPLANAQ
jgi:uncharacterized membrane protein